MEITKGKKGPITSGAKKRIPIEKPVAVQRAETHIPFSEKVAIVGFAPSRNLAPYDDKSWQMWGVNELYHCKDVKRIDILFELHDYKWIEEGKRNKDHLVQLRKMEIPIWMQQHFDDIPNSLPFPRQQMHEKFGHYFTNTISWEIALAIHIGVKELGIYGVNMATDLEYRSQRPSVEWMIGWVQGAGIKVTIPSESDLLKTAFQYGFEDGELSVFSTKLDSYVKEQQDGIASIQPQIQNLVAALNQKVGAVNSVAYIKNSFVYPNGNFLAERDS